MGVGPPRHWGNQTDHLGEGNPSLVPNNRVIFKYPVASLVTPRLEREPMVKLPYGARIIHAAPQGSSLCVWAEIDPAASVVEREFKLVLTGDPLPQDADYINSFLLDGGSFVTHLYIRRANHTGEFRNHHDQEPAGATAR